MRPRSPAVQNPHFIDLTSPTIEAVARIGGRAALSSYDGLIAEHADFRWLGGRRARVATGILAVKRLLAAAVGALT